MRRLIDKRTGEIVEARAWSAAEYWGDLRENLVEVETEPEVEGQS